MKWRQELLVLGAFVCFALGQVGAAHRPRSPHSHEKRPHSASEKSRHPISEKSPLSVSEKRPHSVYEKSPHSASEKSPRSASREEMDEVRAFGASRQGLESVSECLIKFSFMRCTKAFLLSRMERQRRLPDTGHIGRDFVNSLYSGASEGRGNEGNLLESFKAYDNFTDEAVSKRLRENLQRFFKNRNIKLHVLPGLLVKVVPSRDNSLKFAFKKGYKSRSAHSGRSRAAESSKESDADGESEEHTNTKFSDSDSESLGKRKHKKPMLSHKHNILQMVVPVMIMPVILAWTALPFLLPVLKMATFMSIMMNNFAFIASLIMAARAYAAQDDPEPVNYSHHYH